MKNDRQSPFSLPIDDMNNDLLSLEPISINDDYRKEWNVREDDFFVLRKNGELLRPTLYRIGGLSNFKLNEDNYFMLLKYVEAYYSDDIINTTNGDPKHLEGKWCILDKNGVERIEFDQYKSPYLVENSCIYSIDSKYYNIETGEFYCRPSSVMGSSEFLFLENRYDDDETKRGVMMINKSDGKIKLFK